jgi:hypothetical protein
MSNLNDLNGPGIRVEDFVSTACGESDGRGA